MVKHYYVFGKHTQTKYIPIHTLHNVQVGSSLKKKTVLYFSRSSLIEKAVLLLTRLGKL